MAQTEASLGTAKEFIREIETKNRLGVLLSVRMLLNAFETHDRRSQEGWFHAVSTWNHSGEILILFNMEEEWRDMRHAAYVVDNGEKVVPYYVAGWNVSAGFLLLSPVGVEKRTPYLANLMMPRRAYFAYTTELDR